MLPTHIRKIILELSLS